MAKAAPPGLCFRHMRDNGYNLEQTLTRACPELAKALITVTEVTQMLRRAVLMFIVCSSHLSAQLRLRPMGELHLNNIALSFEASSANLFSIEVRQRGRRLTACTLSPSLAQHWADSSEAVLLQRVDPPTAPDRIEYLGPSTSPAADCDIRTQRTLTHEGSAYFLFVDQLGTRLTLLQVKSLVAKIREVARVTQELTPLRPISAADSQVQGNAPPAVTSSDQPYLEFQVEKQAVAMPDNPRPRYPDMLKSANVEGEVLAQFVVDTAGRVEMSTLKVLKSSHDLFTNSVKSALANMRFYPAEVGGRRVRQLVQMPFIFGLNATPGNNSPTSRTASTAGLDFAYPGYLANIARQIDIRFKPASNSALRVDAFFLINRDGTVSSSSIRLVSRSGQYSFDVDAQGAVEAAAAARAFGPLPTGYPEESLPVTVRLQPGLTRVVSVRSGEGSEDRNYPPSLLEIFLPPLPPPKSVSGFHLVAEFDVDATGNILSFTFTPTPDADYNRKLEEILRRLRFRPGTTSDGAPIRMKAQVNYNFSQTSANFELTIRASSK